VPVYQYACTECGEQLEERQSFTDEPLSVCPVCAGRLRKVLSAVGVVFKGSGFYRTDSRAKETADSGAKAGPGSSGPTGGESTSTPAASEKSSTPTSTTPSTSAGSSAAGSSSAAKAAS
jgi:putative FmdB family regulatory protein